ncbi:uncharacterized protein K452DRAFT_326613 [Aplosporella prunicola CBS 121167]|uniref:DUF6594 domain-containing protein n=1 Tax=Aplosporella prunicola CBS 121167 TaxID=1176127 RepID=A0A6A6BFR5_9PEZI|nr:uncharacterized protein K452DRAFT_326613 [Aplosporella prunicola CBS 121167]KAF2142084.1 hypothetical protein K452DRAFT_326613 [Aplosporella prunicola CBS 121167]
MASATGFTYNNVEVIELNQRQSGYPRLAAFINSDEQFMMFRRFGYIQTRLLLEKQAKLMKLERHLNFLDSFEGHETPSKFADRSKMQCFKRPTKQDHRSVVNFNRNEAPIVRRESLWVNSSEDLVALRPAKEPDWMERMIERSVTALDRRFLTDIFQTTVDRAKSIDMIYYNRSRIQRTATAIIALLVSILLVLPISICYVMVIYIGGNKAYGACIGIIFLSTLIFSVCTSIFSNAKRSEVLAATSAYCAVLVVFLGGVGQ